MKALVAYLQLMRWHSPIGALLLLAPVCWALFIAFDGVPPIQLAIVFVCGVWFSRSLGCVINDIFDRKIDAQVARTKSRPLADGRLSIAQALVVACALVFVCIFLLMQLPLRVVFHGAVALTLLTLYPLMKRVFFMPQLILALAFSWSIVIVFVVADPQLAWYELPTAPACWLLFAANCAWVVAYDTQYAMMDIADDRRIGVQSSARLFGRAQHAITALLLMTFVVLLFVLRELMPWNKQVFLLVLVVLSCWLFYLLRLTRGATDPIVYKRAFRHHAAIGLAVAGGMALAFFV